jgi:hypothetical protein
VVELTLNVGTGGSWDDNNVRTGGRGDDNDSRRSYLRRAGDGSAGGRRSLDLTVGDLGDGLDAVVLRNSDDGTSQEGNGGDGETHVDDVVAKVYLT